jgi:hypothetical protein
MESWWLTLVDRAAPAALGLAGASAFIGAWLLWRRRTGASAATWRRRLGAALLALVGLALLAVLYLWQTFTMRLF